MNSFLIAVLVLSTFSIAKAESMLEKCKVEVKSIAQMNMDQKARSYGFDGAAVDSLDVVTLDREIETKIEKLYEFSTGAYIYKGSYTVKVVLDSSCAVSSVNITENL